MRSRLVVLVVLLLSGCSNTSTSYVDYHFKSLEELADVLKKADWDCGDSVDGEEATNNSLAKYEWAQESCDRGSIALFASDAKRAEIVGHSFNALEPGKARIDGGNWEVLGDQYKVDDAQKLLGGTRTLG